MKRVLWAVVVIVAAAGFLPVYHAAAQGTNNFTITSYDIQYELSRDSESRSILKTVETITAEFPDYDQNHGLERAIPTVYNGHSTSLHIDSVGDGEGSPLSYSATTHNDMLVLRIGDANTYVHGTQTYTITYTQRDVTRYYQDTGRDEWYWDTNGVQWQVPIQALTVTATLSSDIAAARDGQAYCYVGVSGSSTQCQVSEQGTTYTAAAQNLAAGENVTLALGFTTGTFAQYQPTLFERLATVWLTVFIITAVLGFILVAFVLTASYSRRRNRVREQEPIAVEYIPPRDASVLIAAQVVTPRGSVFSAQLIDLAVRHYIQIIEMKKANFWGVGQYDIQVTTDPSNLFAEEQEILFDMFGHLPSVGERLALTKLRTDPRYIIRTSDNDKKMKQWVEDTYGLRQKSPAVSRFFYRWAIALLMIGIITLSPVVLIYAGIAMLYGFLIRPLTDKGLALRRYVLGLDRYIKAAEVDRLKFLQGPDTAEKVGETVDTKNPGQLVKLYERVLPYAVLFGREKDWTKRLGECYETAQTSPSWYTGQAAFNAVYFTAAMNSFSTAASYSGGSGSSSTGGSSGGGSSGGGGGGGGGGGW